MISILTPSYNYERFLSDALLSVSGQSAGMPFEHVVVDDGSRDESVRLLEEWPAPLVIRAKGNEGQSATLNAALSLSRGEWIGWLNSDDFYLPGAFDEISKIQDTREVDVIHGDALYVDEDGRVLRLVPQHPLNLRTLRRYGPTMCPSSVFVRRELLLDETWDTNFRLLLDWDLWLRLAYGGARFHYVPRPLSAFRWHTGQVSRNPLPSVDEEFRAVARRYGMPLGQLGFKSAHLAGRLEHGARKLTSGAYQRQSRVRSRYKGADVRWFESDSARRRTEHLLTIADGRRS